MKAAPNTTLEEYSCVLSFSNWLLLCPNHIMDGGERRIFEFESEPHISEMWKYIQVHWNLEPLSILILLTL